MAKVLESEPAIREVPGVGRLTVPDDDPELVSLLRRVTRDVSAIGELADWLRGRDDARADLVDDLAAPGVVADAPPESKRHTPLVAGEWWGAVRLPGSVRAWAYRGTPLAAAIKAAGKGTIGGGVFGCVVDSSRRCRPGAIRRYLDECRCHLLLALFGTDEPGVAALASHQNLTLFSNVPRLLADVPPGAGARWLRDFARTDPRWFAAVVREVRMSPLIRLPEYAEFAAPAGGAKG